MMQMDSYGEYDFAETATESSIDCQLSGCTYVEWNFMDNDDMQ